MSLDKPTLVPPKTLDTAVLIIPEEEALYHAPTWNALSKQTHGPEEKFRVFNQSGVSTQVTAKISITAGKRVVNTQQQATHTY